MQNSNINCIFAPANKNCCLSAKDDFVAQLVEQLTLNQWAEGSSPSEVTENKPLTEVGGFSFCLYFSCVFNGQVKPGVKPDFNNERLYFNRLLHIEDTFKRRTPLNASHI